MYKKKKVIIISMCVMALCMIIGYAAFSSSLKINGTATIETKWEILFTKIEKIKTVGKASERVTPTVNGTTATFHVDLVKPNDAIEYKITIENRGDFNAIIEEIVAKEQGSDAVKFKIENISKGDKLTKKSSTTFNVTVFFDENITDSPTLTDNTLTIEVKYSQDVGQSVLPDNPIMKTERLSSRILKDNVAQSDTNIDFSKISSDTNGKGLYYTNKNTEGNKTTYYFRGEVDNNYVSFAGHLWRIVRINEDGSIRLIKQESIGSSVFNKNAGDNAFVGYMHGKVTTYKDGRSTYDKPTVWTSASSTAKLKMSTSYTFNSKTGEYALVNPVNGNYTNDYLNYYTCMSSSKVVCNRIAKILSTALRSDGWNDLTIAEFHTAYFSESYEQAHKNEVDSAIKKYIDTWYEKNLINYTSYLADAGFCNDRSLPSGRGYAQHESWYSAERRLASSTNPQFACPNESRDLFTTSTSSKGNKALTYPIGLITADEMAYAGAVNLLINDKFYLQDGKLNWTMSPYGFNTADRMVRQWNMVINRSLFSSGVPTDSHGVRPIVNLKANIEIVDGDGTSTNPYIVN